MASRKPTKKRRAPQGHGRRAKKKRPHGATKRHWFSVLWKVALFFSVLGALVAGGGYVYLTAGLPDYRSLSDYRPLQTNRILSSDGYLLGEIFKERRTFVPLGEISPHLVRAVISAEDGDFYGHEGLDYTGMLRALFNSFKRGRIAGGGSTITQQTVKNLILTPERTLRRKVRELVLSRRLETYLSKDDILTIYLNAIYMGHGRYGVEEASQYYFGVPAKDINVNQAAALAGLIQSPERISPRKHPKRALQRRAYVLRQMAKNGYISSAQAQTEIDAPLQLAARTQDSAISQTRWFVDAVKKRVRKILPPEEYALGGYEILTTLDMKRQRAAVSALGQGLTALEVRRRHGPALETVPRSKRSTWIKKRARKLKGEPKANSIHRALITAKESQVTVNIGGVEAMMASAALEPVGGKKRFKTGDVIRVKVLPWQPGQSSDLRVVPAQVPQGALVVMDVPTRGILALVGGREPSSYAYNRAMQAKRQPGSAFKPLVWAAALETRDYTPATRLVDGPETIRLSGGKVWTPKNYTGKYLGLISLRQALNASVNTIAVSLTDRLGTGAVIDFAQRAGVNSPMPGGLALALGAGEVDLLELTNAYAGFADEGRGGLPRLITRVSGPNGEFQPDRSQSDALPGFDPGVAYLTRSLLRSAVTDGTGRRLKEMKRPIAGKTGTTNGSKDAWFIGILPEVALGAWVGFDNGKSLGKKESGGRTAVPIIKAYLEVAELDGPQWPDPPTQVVSSLINSDGKLVDSDYPGAFPEYFMDGTEPKVRARRDDELDASNFLFQGRGSTQNGPEDDQLPQGELDPSLLPIRPAQAVRAPVETIDVQAPVEPSLVDEDLPP